jgi:hypothetical protein
MPYEIKKVPGGYKVKSEGSGRYFSKKPLSYEKARKQQQAIYLHTKSMMGGENYHEFLSFIDSYTNKNDLNIINKNYSFKMLQGGGNVVVDTMKGGDIENKVDTMSFLQVEHLINHEFHRAGWMILAKHHGHFTELESYKKSLREIMISLKKQYDIAEGTDLKNDMNKLYKQVHILHNWVENNL